MFDDTQTNQSEENQSVTDNGPVPAASLGGASPQADQPGDDQTEVIKPTLPQDNNPDEPTGSPSDDLSEIKRNALEQLSPLVHKLNQSPEEKYKTLMMMIQASDNQDLLKEAYESAQKIEDDKAKAEALLNIVNEINYFTQKG